MSMPSYDDAQPMDMECDEAPFSARPAGGVAALAHLLPHDMLRHIFQFVPDLDRRALQPVCKTWALVGSTSWPLVTSATIDAEEYAWRRGRQLDWHAALHWLSHRLHRRQALSTVSLKTTAHHNMPTGALLGVLPAFACSLRTLHLHVGAPGLTSRDLVGVGRLTQLQHLGMSVQLTAEVLVTGLQELRPLSSLTYLSFQAIMPAPVPADPLHPDDFPTPNYAAKYPSGVLHATFSLDLASMPDLQTLRFVADARAVLFDTLPPGLTSLTALTWLHLNNCFAEPQPPSFSSLSQLQRLALEDFKFQTPQTPLAVHSPATPAAARQAHPLDQLSGLSSLRQLSLRRCKLDASGVRLMAQLLPQLEVQAELAQGCKALLLCIERHAAELDVAGNRRLDPHEGPTHTGALDSWWLKQYLAGRCRKRKPSPTMYSA